MKKKLIFSNHAKERLEEYRISESRANNLWISSRRVKVPFGRDVYKVRKYGCMQADVRYFWAGGFLLTVDEDKGLLITITRKPAKKVKLK